MKISDKPITVLSGICQWWLAFVFFVYFVVEGQLLVESQAGLVISGPRPLVPAESQLSVHSSQPFSVFSVPPW